LKVCSAFALLVGLSCCGAGDLKMQQNATFQ